MVFPTEWSKGVCISKKLSERNVVWFVGLNRGFLCRLLVTWLEVTFVIFYDKNFLHQLSNTKYHNVTSYLCLSLRLFSLLLQLESQCP